MAVDLRKKSFESITYMIAVNQRNQLLRLFSFDIQNPILGKYLGIEEKKVFIVICNPNSYWDFSLNHFLKTNPLLKFRLQEITATSSSIKIFWTNICSVIFGTAIPLLAAALYRTHILKTSYLQKATIHLRDHDD